MVPSTRFFIYFLKGVVEIIFGGSAQITGAWKSYNSPHKKLIKTLQHFFMDGSNCLQAATATTRKQFTFHH